MEKILIQMIDAFREEFAKLSPSEQKYEQMIDSLKDPCQIYLLISKDVKTHMMIIAHFKEIHDKTIRILPLTTNFIKEIEAFEKEPQWNGKILETTGATLSPSIRSALISYGREIWTRQGLLRGGPVIGMKMLISNTYAVWRIYGDLNQIDFKKEAINAVRGYKASADQSLADKNKKEPVQITESIPDSTGGLGTYFYPPILVGEIKPTLGEQIQDRMYQLYNEKAMMGEFDGTRFVVSKGGLIGLETNDHEKAENILNIIMGTAILMGLSLHTIKSHEIANITINKQTFTVTGSSWTESTYRMTLFHSFSTYRGAHFSRTKISHQDLEDIIEKSKTLTKTEHLNKLKLLSGAYTHLDNDEFSQSFIMSWTVVEIHIHELWNKKIQTSGVTKKIRDDLDRWDFYRVLEVLHLDKIVSNDDYYELKHLNGLRNDIIHDGHEVTKKQATQCYDLAKTIMRTELNITQQIKTSQAHLGI